MFHHLISRARRSGLRAAVSSLAVAAALLGATACGSDSPTGPRSPDGIYALRTVDDDGLPVEIHHGPYFDPVNVRFYNLFIVRVVDGEVELEDDRFLMSFELAITADGQTGTARIEIEGDYEIDGSTILFHADDIGTQSASFRSGVIGIEIDFMGKGVTNEFTFRR